MSDCLIVAWKEIRDHARDTRSLMSSALYALMGPLVILLVSASERAADGGPRLLLSMMSVFTLVSAFAGGMNIAMDSTAGERERRSLVPLLLNPTPRLHLIVGKWIGVTVFALAGLAITLVGFTIVLESRAPSLLVEYAPALSLWIVCGLIPLALFGAALDLLVSAMCRTAKEAHTRLSILILVPMVVGMFLVFFPDWIGRWWFAVPIVGQQALIGIGLQGGSLSVLQSGVLGLLTTAAAAPALIMAARVLDRDEMLAG